MDVHRLAAPQGTVPGPVPQVAVAPPNASAASSAPADAGVPLRVDGALIPPQSGTIAGAVAKLFGGDTAAHLTLNVSYRVLPQSNEIVTIFSDPNTGKEVAQFPPEILIGIAQFFDQHQGATLDRNA